MEKFQSTIFCVQEYIISGVYIWAALRFFQPFSQLRFMMTQLIWISIAIFVMDAATVTVEYMGCHLLQVALKGAIYSVKLKMEFAVLNQLISITKAPFHGDNIA